MNPFLLHIELVRYSKMDENDTVTDVGKGSKEFSLHINIIKCLNFLILIFECFFPLVLSPPMLNQEWMPVVSVYLVPVSRIVFLPVYLSPSSSTPGRPVLLIWKFSSR